MSLNDALTLLGLKGLSYSEMLWVIIGLLGQLIFFSRWVVQWIASEKNSKSVIPTPFWWCSLCGGLITFVYAYHISSFSFYDSSIYRYNYLYKKYISYYKKQKKIMHTKLEIIFMVIMK